MNELPQRRKSPEELAALRAKHDRRFQSTEPEASTVEASPQSRAMEPISHAEPDKNEVAPLPPERETPRRLIPAKHGTVTLGEQAEALLQQQSIQAGTRPTKLPERRRSESELMRLRRNQTAKNEIPVQHILKMSLHPALSTTFYLLTVCMVYFTFATWLKRAPSNFIAPVGGGGLLIVISCLLYWKKPRARHHAAIVTAVSVLTMGFVILTYIKNHAP